MAPKILLQNEDLVVVDKEAGYLSVPARFGEADPRPVVGLELQTALGKQIYPVHRLDFEVSGLLIFALNPQTHKILNAAFENGKIKKTYQALCEVSPEAQSFPLNSPQMWKSKIVRGKKRSFFAEHGKESLTEALLISASPERAEWKLHPHTGRPHQLRLELASRGYPIQGDKLYGAQSPYKPNAIALRCTEMDLGSLKGANALFLTAPPLFPAGPS